MPGGPSKNPGSRPDANNCTPVVYRGQPFPSLISLAIALGVPQSRVQRAAKAGTLDQVAERRPAKGNRKAKSRQTRMQMRESMHEHYANRASWTRETILEIIPELDEEGWLVCDMALLFSWPEKEVAQLWWEAGPGREYWPAGLDGPPADPLADGHEESAPPPIPNG